MWHKGLLLLVEILAIAASSKTAVVGSDNKANHNRAFLARVNSFPYWKLSFRVVRLSATQGYNSRTSVIQYCSIIVFPDLMVFTFVKLGRKKGVPSSDLVLLPVPRSNPTPPRLSIRLELRHCFDFDVFPIVCNACHCCQILSEIGLQEKRQDFRRRGRLRYLQQFAGGKVNVCQFSPPPCRSSECSRDFPMPTI